MRFLVQLALDNRRHYMLLIFTFIAMISLTLASQMEIFALRVMTDKGPDFFELFAEESGGKLVPSDLVDQQTVASKWGVIDQQASGTITRADADRYMAKWQGKNLVTKLVYWMDEQLKIFSNPIFLVLLLILVAVFKAGSLFCHRYTTRLVAIRVSRDLRQKYFEHLQTMSMSFYQKYQTGSLSSRVLTDAGIVAQAINAGLINYFQTPFMLVSTLVFCFISSWRLSMIIFMGFPLVVLPIVILSRRVRKVTRQMLGNQERFASVLLDFLSGIQTVKVFGMEDFSLRKYREQNDTMARLEEKTARYSFSSRPIIHMLGTCFIASIIIYGLYGLHMSVSEILFFCGMLLLFYEPVKKFAEENALIQRGIAAAERMQEVLALAPQIQDRPNAMDLKGFEDKLEFDDVWFRYEENWVLRGLSFSASRGDMVALVGPTGAGKSTIAQLLPRLYECQKGEVRIDGHSVAAYTQKSLRDCIGFVPQRPFFFLDTVAENIAFGRDYSRAEVEAAAKQAYAGEFIENLPEGYDSQLAEAGKNLSGGQQQRLAIARALVKKAPILILDEATSSLDGASENRIKLALRELRGHVTQIVIAHRLSTIEDADKIVYIAHGRKVAEGTKDELLASCPEFREMWEAMHHGES